MSETDGTQQTTIDELFEASSPQDVLLVEMKMRAAERLAQQQQK